MLISVQAVRKTNFRFSFCPGNFDFDFSLIVGAGAFTRYRESWFSINLLPDKERLHFVGRLIRSLSLDELPQLINILRGEMSLIGPRPLLFKYIPLYRGDQARRHEVRPGITGWAQVNGRNSISWTKKFEYDVYYVDHLSFWLDMKILWLTIIKVLRREGINQSEERPMQPFDGTN